MIARIIAINHTGNTLLRLKPTPNCRKDPSGLNISDVLLNTNKQYNIIKITMANTVIFFLTNGIFILIIS